MLPVLPVLFSMCVTTQMIKAIVDSCSFKSPKSDEPRRVQVWTCIVLLGLRVKIQVKELSIKD